MEITLLKGKIDIMHLFGNLGVYHYYSNFTNNWVMYE